MNVSKHNGRPPFWHANWERALHRFHRDNPPPVTEHAGAGAHNVWLAQLHRFHAQWFAIRENRERAEKIVKCEVCEADYERALLSRKPWPEPAPPALVESLRSKYGIVHSGRRVSTGDLTPIV